MPSFSKRQTLGTNGKKRIFLMTNVFYNLNNMNKIIFVLLTLSMFLATNSCKKKNDDDSLKQYNLSGKAQKGPFAPGANVTISELDENLNPTGRNFYTTIMDYEGNFQIPNVELASSYVELKVEGSHYNEYIGVTLSMSPITLYCIVDLSQSSHNNVNILTHLEKDRLIKYKHDGYSFSEAKRLAQKEVLKIFNLDNISIQNSENLDISNGILLATSLIIQGSRDGSQLTTILTNIRNDLNDNGILNSIDLQSRLISQAKFIYVSSITKNLNNYYNSIGNSSYVVPQFENYIDTFIVNSNFTSTANYIYPELSQQGINLLYFTQDTININTSNTYSMSIQTDINSKINMEFQLSKISGSGSWTANNSQYWTVASNDIDFLNCNLYNQPNKTTDISLVFQGQGIAQIHVNTSLLDYYMDISYDRYIKWGY